jgi:hypothetical protein
MYAASIASHNSINCLRLTVLIKAMCRWCTLLQSAVVGVAVDVWLVQTALKCIQIEMIF